MLINIYQFELLRQLTENKDNVVVTIVRNKTATDSKVTAEIPGRKNIFVLRGDLTDVDSLKVDSTETPGPEARFENGTVF